MARLTWTLFAFALLACALLAPAASASHVQCGDALTADTTLDSDLRNCPGDGLVIAAPDITVDFNGHVVDGAGSGNGVRAERDAGRHFTLVAGTIRQFQDGVFTENSFGYLRAMRILDNTAYGVEAYGAGASIEDSVVAGNRTGTWEASTVRNSTFRRNSEGAITLSEGVGTITDNIVRRNGAGILAGEGDGTIARNIVTDNPRGGISWHFSGEGAIRDNFIARNGNGISVNTFARPVIEGNVLLHNHSDGIVGRWTDGFGSVIRNNWVRENEGSGIVVTGHDPCPQLQDNHLDHNGKDGVLMTGLSTESGDCDEGVPVTGNTATRNAGDGFHVSDNSGVVLLRGNRADRNGDDGIDIDPRAADLIAPAWSPSGGRVAFSGAPARGELLGGPSLYVSRPDGTDVRLITSGEHPDWSPNGERIAYVIQTQVSAEPSQLGVYTIKPDGTDRVKLVSSGGRPGFPTWSPDGRTILYDDVGTIYTVPASGGSPKAITAGTPANDPEWSPDGSRILFESSQDFLGDGNIYITGAEGGPATVLAKGRRAAWSPDGDHVVFERDGNLYVINADGAGQRALTSGLLSESRPAWSPTGAEIGFQRDGALAGLHSIAPNGSGSRQVAPSWEPGHSDARAAPSWSLDGRRIAFEIDGRIFVVNRDGSGLVRLTIPGNPLVTVSASRADRNDDLGIEATEEVADGGGNTAKRNGDKRQCVNVPCN